MYMTKEKLIFLAKTRLFALILAGLFLGAVSFLFLVTTQKSFKASADLLVVQNQNGFTDYYALSKSADFLTGVLTESVYSEKFLEEMNNTGKISQQFLPDNKLERLKEWERIVKINRNPGLGIIHVEVFGDSPNQVTEISNAITDVLINRNFLFLGKGQDLDVRVLNGPIWEKNPSIGSIILVAIGGFVIGFLLVLLWIFYRAEKYEAMLKNQTGNQEPDEYEESLRYLEK